MANARYEVLELRVVIQPNWTELYVRCSPDNEGGVLVGGWYKKILPPEVPGLDALTKAMKKQDYLLWDKGSPDRA